MSDLDLLILVVYTITIVIVMVRAIESLDKKTKVDFKDARFKEYLERYELSDKIKVKFKFDDRYPIDAQPSKLALTIENKSKEAIYVDWDRSSINDLDGRSRRAIRLTPYHSPDLSQPQAPTVIPPESSVQEAVTAESCLAPDEVNPKILNPQKPLLDIKGLEKAGIKSKEKKKLYEDFMEEKLPLIVPFWMALQMGEMDRVQRGDRLYVLPCDIVTKKMPWTDSLPWKPDKK